MEPKFDIFKSFGNGTFRWVEAAHDLTAAKERIRLLGEAFPGRYLILNQKSGEKTTVEAGTPRGKTLDLA